MDGSFDIRHESLGLDSEGRNAASETRPALLITLAVIILAMGALLTLDAFGLAPFAAPEFPGLQDIGLLG